LGKRAAELPFIRKIVPLRQSNSKPDQIIVKSKQFELYSSPAFTAAWFPLLLEETISFS
jgi:hypothetical protein